MVPVPVPVVVVPLSGMPVIFNFRSANERPRFCDTLIAAMNCPKFLNPAVARFKSVFAGRAFFAFVIRFDFVESFCETGLVGFHVSVVVVDVLPVDVESPLVVEPDDVDDVDVEFVVELAVVVDGDFFEDFEDAPVVFVDEPFVLVDPEVVGFADEPFDLV